MGRRKNNSLIGDIIDIASKLTWYANLLCAASSYLIFHYLASRPAPTPKNISDFSDAVWHQIITSGSMILQYLLPACFLIGMLVSIFRSKYRKRLIEEQMSLETIRNLSWQDFEKLVGEAFRRKGYAVTEVGGGGPDEGIDLVLTKEGKTTLVQCKNWRRDSIGVTTIRELYGVMAAHRVPFGIVVCSGTYTTEAERFAETNPIELIDGPQLLDLVKTVQTNTNRTVIEHRGVFEDCPICGSKMVPRMARRGANAGNKFLGCINYPRCKGTRPA